MKTNNIESKRMYTNALGWTNENHPNRQELETNLLLAKKEAEGMGKMWGEYEDLNEKQRNYVDALALLEVWDYDFGPKMIHSTDLDDPTLLEVATKKQEWLLMNTTSMPTPEAQLASMKEPPETIKIIMELEQKYGIGKGIDLAETYETLSVSYLFDRIPTNNEAMNQLRKYRSKSSLAQCMNGSEIVYIPLTYLCVAYSPEKINEAVSLLSSDLALLSKSDSIFGHLSMPKILKLKVIPDKHVMYCWPFVNLYSLAKSVEKDFGKDFNYDQQKLLDFIGTKTHSTEGRLGLNTL